MFCIQSIEELIGLKEAQAPGIVNQWKQQLNSGFNARSGKPLTNRQKLDIQNKINKYETQPPVVQPSQQTGTVTPTQNQMSEVGVEATPTPQQVSEVGAQPVLNQGVADPTQFFNSLRDSVRGFGKSFNEQTIRPYNAAITQALQTIESLSKTPNISISPQLQQAGTQLIQIIQQIQASDAQDLQFVNQLGQMAQQLAQVAGPAPQNNPTVPQATDSIAQPGIAEQVGKSVGQVAKAPGRAVNWMGQQLGKGVDWARQQGNQFGQGFSNAETEKPVLTAQIGSADQLFK